MFQEPESKNSFKNRMYDGEGELTDNDITVSKNDIYQLPERINSEHNRGVDGEISDSSWPLTIKTDPWYKGIEEQAVNSNDITAVRDARLNAVAHEMWEL